MKLKRALQEVVIKPRIKDIIENDNYSDDEKIDKIINLEVFRDSSKTDKLRIISEVQETYFDPKFRTLFDDSKTSKLIKEGENDKFIELINQINKILNQK